MAIYKTPSGVPTLELYDADEFLLLDSKKASRKEGLYVTHHNHQNEVCFGKTLEAVKPGAYKAVYPLDDTLGFDVAIVKLETGTVIQIYEFKARTYPSTRRFKYGPEVQKVAKMREIATQWGVRAFFAHRWSDGIIRHIEINDEFISQYHKKEIIGSLFNADPTRIGEAPDDIYHLEPEAYHDGLTVHGRNVFASSRP